MTQGQMTHSLIILLVHIRLFPDLNSYTFVDMQPAAEPNENCIGVIRLCELWLPVNEATLKT